MLSKTLLAEPINIPYTSASILPYGDECVINLTISGTITINNDLTVSNHGTITIIFDGVGCFLDGTQLVVTFRDTDHTRPEMHYSNDILTQEQKVQLSNYIDTVTDKY